jgi:hypothetical protein
MAEIKRESPVKFDVSPLETKVRNNWTVALEYANEGQGPWLVDLAHKVRWDLQDKEIDRQTPCGLAVPAAPGACTFGGAVLVNRMNRTQASIYHLGAEAPAMPDFSGYTDVTESTLFLALFGPNTFSIAEKLTNLDLKDPLRAVPFLLQGPFCHVPCQIVVVQKSTADGNGFLLTCSRGYGASMVQAVMHAGIEFNLRPAGENRFSAWLAGL